MSQAEDNARLVEGVEEIIASYDAIIDSHNASLGRVYNEATFAINGIKRLIAQSKEN